MLKNIFLENVPLSPKKENFKDKMHRVINKIKPRSKESTPVEEAAHHFKSAGLEGIEKMERLSDDGKIKFINYTTFGEPKSVEHSTTAHINKSAPLIMEPKNRNLMRRIVFNMKPTKNKRRWRMALDQEDTAEEYVIK